MSEQRPGMHGRAESEANDQTEGVTSWRLVTKFGETSGLALATKQVVEDLAQGVLDGNRRALARAITLVESTRADHRAQAAALLQRLTPHAGKSVRLGISGVPGAGKSTFIEALGNRVIDAGHRVAVLTVDPSSAISGGSILGDKTRMEELSRRHEAYIRPSPSGNTLGGIARRTREAMLLCEAAGFDVIIVETVGVGQSETRVAEMTDMFVLLLLQGGGDELRGIKRDIMEHYVYTIRAAPLSITAWHVCDINYSVACV